jgi:acetyl-CoA C-acetyltransferase
MGKVGIIGVGQSAFVRGFPGSIRELAFEGYKECMADAKPSVKDIDATVVCSALSTTSKIARGVPEYLV